MITSVDPPQSVYFHRRQLDVSVRWLHLLVLCPEFRKKDFCVLHLATEFWEVPVSLELLEVNQSTKI